MGQRPKVGELLLRAGVVDEYQLRSALGEQKRWGSRLGMTLVKMGFMDEEDLVRVLASQLRLPVAHLEGKRIHAEVLDLVPVETAQKEMVLPLFVKHEGGVNTLYLGMEDPTDLETLDDLSFRTGMQIKPVLVGPSELAEGVDRFYREHEVGPEVEPAASDTPPTAAPAEQPAEALPEVLPDLELGVSVDEISLAGDPAAQLETSFRDLLGEHDPGAAPPASGPLPGQAAPKMARRTERSSRVILQAVTQLLIEKGVLGRDELFARVRRLQDAESAQDS